MRLALCTFWRLVLKGIEMRLKLRQRGRHITARGWTVMCSAQGYLRRPLAGLDGSVGQSCPLLDEIIHNSSVGATSFLGGERDLLSTAVLYKVQGTASDHVLLLQFDSRHRAAH